MGFSASPKAETKLKGLNASTDANDEVAQGLKHVTVDVGPTLSTKPYVVRRTNSRLGQWHDKTMKYHEGTEKKGGKEMIGMSPRHYLFWICLLTLLLLVFVWPGHQEGKSLSKYWDSPRVNCTGRRVYMYDLPPELNIAMKNESRCYHRVMHWVDLCPRFSHKGYGVKLWDESNRQPAGDDFDYSQWFDTCFYMLEMIFHTRLQSYPCLTKDVSQADAFFIPYYTGLVALDPLYETEDLTTTYEKRKLFGIELIDWLDKNGGEHWRRYGARDHFLIMGRTSWDFKLQPEWGTGFSALPYVNNMTILTLEKDAREPNEHAIPYPTAFHPNSPQQIQSWIERVKAAKRKYLVAYVGAPRSDSWSVRGIISSSCTKAGPSVCHMVDCTVVKCSHDPVSIYKSFLQSTFCLQPRGDSATRRSTFDCLVSGAIPVFFSVDSAYTQYSWHLPEDPESYSVYISEADLKKGVSIQEVLMSYSKERIEDMRRNILAIVPNLLYNDFETDPSSTPKHRKDAFEVSMDRVLESIAAAKEQHSVQLQQMS